MFSLVGDAIDRSALDSIVANAVKKFDNELEACDYSKLSPREDLEKLENNIYADIYVYYDKLSYEQTGKIAPLNWSDGERQDLQSVRKRMLKRELEKRRGKLKENFDRSNFQRATQMDKVISAVGAEHDEFISSLQFPINPSVLRDRFAQHESGLRTMMASAYPDGIVGLDKDSQKQKNSPMATIFLKSVDFDKQKAMARNDLEIHAAKDRMQCEVLFNVQHKLKNAFEAIVQQEWEQTVGPKLYFLEEYEKPRYKEKLRSLALPLLSSDPSSPPVPPTSPMMTGVSII